MTKIYQRDDQNLYIRQHNDQKIPKGKSEAVNRRGKKGKIQWPKEKGKYNGQKKKDKQLMYKTLQRKLKIEQHQPQNTGNHDTNIM